MDDSADVEENMCVETTSTAEKEDVVVNNAKHAKETSDGVAENENNVENSDDKMNDDDDSHSGSNALHIREDDPPSDEESVDNRLYVTEDINDTVNSKVNNLSDDDESNTSKPVSEEEDKDETSPQEPPSPRAPKRPTDVITIDSDSDDSSICHVESYQATASEAKKLRKGYSSSESSSSSQSSSSEDSNPEPDGAEVISFPALIPTSKIRNTDEVPTDPKLNGCFLSEEVKKGFNSHWTKGEPFAAENINLFNDPFQICVMDNFLEDANAIDGIVNDMNTLEWFRKIMDLYEFHRTADLKDLTWQRSVKSMYELLQSDVMKWVAEVTETNLTHISASCALYGPGDHLLTHDDLLEDRKIAFIFYMAPWDLSTDKNGESASANEDGESSKSNDRKEIGWTKSMGGELEFFSMDEEKKPSTVVRSLLPCNNVFAFFKVGTNSFHQVSEVTSFDFPRLTINGWFHGPVEQTDESSKEDEEDDKKADLFKPNEIVQQNDLTNWVTQIYLTPLCKSRIMQKFQMTFEISLVNYFIQSKYDEVLATLNNEDISWKRRGPANLRNYSAADVEKLKDNTSLAPLKEFVDLFTSKQFMEQLQGYTGLNLESYCKFEIQKWKAGDYTVLPLKDEYAESEVDIVMYLGCPDRLIKGGTITYVLPEEQDSSPIISVGLKDNALNIVHSEPGLAKFTKYISKLSFGPDEQFFMAACSYRSAAAAANE